MLPCVWLPAEPADPGDRHFSVRHPAFQLGHGPHRANPLEKDVALLCRGKPLHRNASALFPSRTGGAEVPFLPGDKVRRTLALEVLPQSLGAQLILVALYLQWGKVEGAAE